MTKKVYLQRIERIELILEAAAKDKIIPKSELYKASKTNHARFKSIYDGLLSTGCLMQQESIKPYKFDALITEKGLEVYRIIKILVSSLEEFSRHFNK